MGTEQPGPGWWQASDSRWYPPELHPSHYGSPRPPDATPSTGWSFEPGNRPPDGHGQPRSVRHIARRTWFATTGAILLLLVGAGTALALTSGSSPVADQTPTPTTTTSPSPGLGGASPAQGGGGPTTLPGAATATVPTPTTIAPPAPPAPASGNLVTTAIEQQVVDSTWKTFSVAFAEGDDATMRPVTTRSAYTAVTGGLACGCRPWPTAYTSVAFTAPPQTTYPLSFWAEIEGKDYDGAAMSREAVFTQASAGSPWLVAYVGSFDGGQPLLSLDPSESDQRASASVPTIGDAEQILTNYGQQIDSTGDATPPSSLASDAILSSAFGTTYWSEFTANGWDATWTHQVLDTSAAFDMTGGGAQAPGACFTLGFTYDVHAANGLPITQPADQSVFGIELAPGSYSSVKATGEADLCFVVDGGQIWLQSNYGGYYGTTGTPAS